jgi:hypothetical protein
MATRHDASQRSKSPLRILITLFVILRNGKPRLVLHALTARGVTLPMYCAAVLSSRISAVEFCPPAAGRVCEAFIQERRQVKSCAVIDVNCLGFPLKTVRAGQRIVSILAFGNESDMFHNVWPKCRIARRSTPKSDHVKTELKFSSHVVAFFWPNAK